MDTGLLNSLVADYLSSVSSKLAEKFKKETKSAPLPAGSPGIAEMVKHYKENTPKASKRKLDMTNGNSPAKKTKKDESSSDDSEDEDDNKNKKPVANGKPAKKAPVEKMEESSSDDDSDSEEEEKPAAKPVAKEVAKPAAAKKDESSSDDDSDSDEDEKPAAKPVAKAAAKKDDSSSDDDSSEDEDEKPAAKAAAPAKPTAKPASKEESSSDEDSSDKEDESETKKSAPAAAVPKAAAKEESSSDDDSSDEEEEEAKPAAKPAPKPAVKKEESSSEDSDSDSDDEEAAPKATKPVAKPAKKEESSDDDSSDDSSDEEEPAPKKVKKEVPAEPMEEDEPAMVVKSNKNKTLDDIKTPTKSHDKSFGDKSFSEEGRKIFIHNVSEEATYEDFQAAVEKHGEVTDFFNPGRGFGFITYSTAEEAQACIKAMDNTEVAGRTIQMNIARPKGEKPAPGTGGKRQEAPEGCKLFVHGITQETDNYSLKEAFEAHGTVTDAYNPGKGFAFVTFSKPSEAQAAIAAFEGQEVCGCYVTLNVAKPRGGGDTPGGRGGKAGGGGRRQEVEGAKLFVHNVSEDTAQEDLWNAFAEHGTVTDAYNPGRGFAFVTFASAEDAQKAMNALEGQEVCGREIQCNVAKPREQKDGGGRGGRGGARGGGRGGRGGRGGGRGGKGMSINVGGGGNNKKISFD